MIKLSSTRLLLSRGNRGSPAYGMMTYARLKLWLIMNELDPFLK